MKHKGPIFTLVAGVFIAAILMVLNLNVTNKKDAAGDNLGNAGNNTAATPPETTAPALTTAPPPTEAPATKPADQPPAVGTQLTYAGKAGNNGATVAIAVKDGKAVAYLCDGKTAEAWLQGTATNGALALTGAGNASLTGTYANGVANGSVRAVGKNWPFSAKVVKPPSGLYRAAATVRGAKVISGWIVLSNGTQVGVMNVDGTAQAAPPLNTTTTSATINGTTVTASAVDGSGL